MRITLRKDGDRMVLDGAPPGRDSPVRTTVSLDGADVSGDCFMADNDAGEVEVYSRNPDGGGYMKNAAGDGIAKEIKRGKVEIFYDGQAC